MEVPSAKPKAWGRSDYLILAIPAVIAVAFVVWTLLPSPNARLCDEAIKETLKAPSTYRRITFSHVVERSYNVQYDASNSFGVPLRGHGSCEIDEARTSAKWVEYPDSIGRMN
jgi:hypothetical protein